MHVVALQAVIWCQHSFEYSVNKQKHFSGLNSDGFWNLPRFLPGFPQVRLLIPKMTLQKLYPARVSIYLQLQVMQIM